MGKILRCLSAKTVLTFDQQSREHQTGQDYCQQAIIDLLARGPRFQGLQTAILR